MSRPTDIFKYLTPEAVLNKTEIPYDTALGEFHVRSSIVRTHAEYEAAIIAFVVHMDTALYNASFPPEESLGRAVEYIRKGLGPENEAVFIALSGARGGLPTVLRGITDAYKKEARERWLKYLMDTFIDPQDFDEVVEVMRELKRRVSSHASGSIDYAKPETMAKFYEAVLTQYVESLLQHKHLWNYAARKGRP